MGISGRTSSTRPLVHCLHSYPSTKPHSHSHLVGSGQTLLRLGVNAVQYHRDISPAVSSSTPSGLGARQMLLGAMLCERGLRLLQLATP